LDQQILVKLRRLELGSKGPILSLVNAANINGEGDTHLSIATPEVGSAASASDMLIAHNIDKLLEDTEEEEDDNSIDSLNSRPTYDANKCITDTKLGIHSFTDSFIKIYSLPNLPALDDKVTDDPVPHGPRPTGGDYYIFWDYRHCPVSKSENLCEIHANIVYLGNLSLSFIMQSPL